MGSRYDGLKQLDQLGPSGESILEYSVYDALRAGFNKLIFIIRKDFANEFKSQIGAKYEALCEVDYCYQELDDLPPGFALPAERSKPWGTGHGLLSIRKSIQEPFLIINADDFYGQESFVQAAKMLDSWQNTQELKAGMVGFKLAQTLSENGTVSRGVCQVKNESLVSVTETHQIKQKDSQIYSAETPLADDTIVSMNMWCFTANILLEFQEHFKNFLSEKIDIPKSEFYIPFVIDELIKNNILQCSIKTSESQWFGVTYKEDKDTAI